LPKGLQCKAFTSLLGGFALIWNPHSAGPSSRQTSHPLAKRPADETYEDWVDERIPLKRGWEKSDSTVSKPDGGAIWDRSGQIVAPLQMISLFLKDLPGFP